jgi:transcriptional regulator with XRE-family HTH domain
MVTNSVHKPLPTTTVRDQNVTFCPVDSPNLAGQRDPVKQILPGESAWDTGPVHVDAVGSGRLDTMAKVTGPTIPRWRLGEELARLRNGLNITTAQVATKLDCSDSKIRKAEAGAHSLSRSELLVMLDMFEVPEADRPPLLELQKLGRQRGWWVQYGRLPVRFTQFLSLEGSATRIKSFEPLMVHGLFQTEDYAKAIAQTVTGSVPADEVDRQVRIRLDRQQQVLEASQPDLWVILDEAAIRHVVGSPTIMRRQLEHLIEIGARHTLQVVPQHHGSYPGFLGGLTLFEFPDELHSPVAYIESHAGNVYLEDKADLERCNVRYEHITAAALNPPASVKLIKEVVKELGAHP